MRFACQARFLSGAVLVAVGALGSACSSSSGGSSPDAGDATSPKDARNDGVADASQGHDAGGDAVGVKESGVDAGPMTAVARFKFTAGTVPNFLDVPYPSDIYLSKGAIVDPIPGVDQVVTVNSKFLTHELAKADGFSRVAMSMLYIDGVQADAGMPAVDPASLPLDEKACVAATSSVFLVDLAASGAAAFIPCRVEFHDDRSFGSGGFAPVLAVGPGRGVVLEEGHQYATVVTSRVRMTTGGHVGASADFLALSSSSATTSVYTTALKAITPLLASALQADGATIVDIAPFTTDTASKVLIQMRDALESVAAPTLAWDSASMAPMGAVKFAANPGDAGIPAGFTASLDDLLGVATAPPLDSGVADPNYALPARAHDKIAAIGTAVFKAQNYLRPSNGYKALDDATFTFDSSGHVVPDPTNPTVPIWATFFIPTAPMPGTGYPVVIVQHGINESRDREPFKIANTFAAAGWVVVAIDSVTFGARAPEAEFQVDAVNNFAPGGGAYDAPDGGALGGAGTYKGPDGLADEIGASLSTNGTSDFVGGFLDLGALRDQLRQSEIDTCQLVRVLKSTTLDLSPLKTGATVPKVDGARIAYFGNSLGSIEGTPVAAIEPGIQTFVMNVAGGGFAQEVTTHSPHLGTDLGFAGLIFGVPPTDHITESHPLIPLIQAIIDPGDPITFAKYVVDSPATVNGAALTAKNFLQVEVVYDNYVPNEGNEALARALGIGLAVPNVGTNAGVSTMAMVKDPTTIVDRLPLPDVNPDTSGLIHDTPSSGVTAVLVQTSPGRHGDEFFQSPVEQEYAIPYDQFTTDAPFVMLGTGSASSDPPFSVDTSYLSLQAMAVRFIGDSFAGKVPNVTGFKPPVRDFDNDGVPDSTDPDPNNPAIK
jgi:hypothetical protein